MKYFIVCGIAFGLHNEEERTFAEWGFPTGRHAVTEAKQRPTLHDLSLAFTCQHPSAPHRVDDTSGVVRVLGKKHSRLQFDKKCTCLLSEQQWTKKPFMSHNG